MVGWGNWHPNGAADATGKRRIFFFKCTLAWYPWGCKWHTFPVLKYAPCKMVHLSWGTPGLMKQPKSRRSRELERVRSSQVSSVVYNFFGFYSGEQKSVLNLKMCLNICMYRTINAHVLESFFFSFLKCMIRRLMPSPLPSFMKTVIQQFIKCVPHFSDKPRSPAANSEQAWSEAQASLNSFFSSGPYIWPKCALWSPT